MSATTDILTTREGTRVVREREFPPSQLQNILLLVHEERLTGQVILDINQGGLCSIRIIEQQKVAP
jgi:hypothetical protein